MYKSIYERNFANFSHTRIEIVIFYDHWSKPKTENNNKRENFLEFFFEKTFIEIVLGN